MSNVIRAWEDEAYHQSLSADEQIILLANPMGETELTDGELEAIFAQGGCEGACGQDEGESGGLNILSPLSGII